MPYHNTGSGKSPKKPMKPLNKPRKQLSALQKSFMSKHKKMHSDKHNKEMVKQMKAGYCMEQAHKLAMSNVGK